MPPNQRHAPAVSDRGVVRFVILAQARSGSGWLADLLRSHPACYCYDELFNRQYINGGIRLAQFKGLTVAERDVDPIGFLERALSAPPRTGVTHVGFKHLPLFDDRVTRHVVEDPHYPVILLTRRDRLAQYASMRIAQESDIWGRFVQQGPRIEQRKVRFDTRDFLDFCRATEAGFAAEREQLRRRGRALLEVTYEELQSAAGLQRVLAFLGLQAGADLVSSHVKENSPRVADRFSNPWRALLIGGLSRHGATRKLLRILRGIRPLRRLTG